MQIFCWRSQMAEKNQAAVELGKRGGAAMAKRGPEYFKRISAMRKNKRGGRPKKADRATAI